MALEQRQAAGHVSLPVAEDPCPPWPRFLSWQSAALPTAAGTVTAVVVVSCYSRRSQEWRTRLGALTGARTPPVTQVPGAAARNGASGDPGHSGRTARCCPSFYRIPLFSRKSGACHRRPTPPDPWPLLQGCPRPSMRSQGRARRAGWARPGRALPQGPASLWSRFQRIMLSASRPGSGCAGWGGGGRGDFLQAPGGL